MARQFDGKKLVLATHNQGKVREIRALLAPWAIDVVSAGELGLDEPIEDGATFIANANIKSLAAAKASGLPALSDDSGLEVHALNGDPGIYSARWAGPAKDFAIAMEHVLEKLKGKTDRSANFTCALSLAWPDGHIEAFEGKVFGTITDAPCGTKGFGYDPIFVADGMKVSFGEIDPQIKHDMSHRADAFTQLIAACFGETTNA